jgi:hypothetical protein
MKSKKLKGLHGKAEFMSPEDGGLKKSKEKQKGIFISTPLIKFSFFPSFLCALFYFSLVLFTFRIRKIIVCFLRFELFLCAFYDDIFCLFCCM